MVWRSLAHVWPLMSWGGLENLENARRRRKEAGRGFPGKSDKEEVREVSQVVSEETLARSRYESPPGVSECSTVSQHVVFLVIIPST